MWCIVLWGLFKIDEIQKHHEKMNMINFYKNDIEKKITIITIEEMNNVLYAYHVKDSKFMSQGKTVPDIINKIVKMNSDIEFVVVTQGKDVDTFYSEIIYDKHGNTVKKITS